MRPAVAASGVWRIRPGAVVRGGLGLVTLLLLCGCQSIGLPQNWGAAHAPPGGDKSAESLKTDAVAASDTVAPELVEQLRPLLAGGNWTLDPDWSLIEATADPAVFRPDFHPGFRWRFTPTPPPPKTAAPSLVGPENSSVPAPETEWDWLFRGNAAPTSEASVVAQVAPALQYLSREETTTGYNALILLWRRFAEQAEDRANVAERLTAGALSVAGAPAQARPTEGQQGALAEAWTRWLSAQDGDPEAALAPAGRLLERTDLTVDVRGALWRGTALRIPPAVIPGISQALKAEGGTARNSPRQYAIEACIIHAVRHYGLKPEWPPELWLARFDPDITVRRLFGRWVAIAGNADAVAILASQRLDEDVLVRDSAIRSLGLVRTEEARKELQRAARKENDALRATAVRMLATWELADLEPFFHDESSRVRAAVIRELYRYPRLQAVAALRDALEDRSPEVQAAALQATRDLPEQLATPLLLHSLRVSLLSIRRSALPQLRERLGFEPVFPIDGNLAEREAALSELVRSRGLSVEFWTKLPGLPSAASQTVTSIALPEIQSLVDEYLAYPDPAAIPEELTERLVRCDTAAIPVLEKSLKGRTGRTAEALQGVLSRLDPAHSALHDLSSPDVGVRRAGTRQLQLEAEQAPLSETILTQLRERLLHEQDRYVWQAAVQAVLSDSREPAAQIALLAVHHAWPDVRLLGLQYVSRHAQPTYGWWLLPLLGDPQPEVRLLAVQLAGKCQNPLLLDGVAASGETPASPGLRSLLTTPDGPLQDAVVISMCQLGDPVGYQELVRRCHSSDAGRRRAAVQAMVRTGRQQFVEPLIQLAWTEPVPHVRREMLSALAALAPEGDRPQPVAPEMTDEPRTEAAITEEQVRAWADWWQNRRGGAKTSALR